MDVRIEELTQLITQTLDRNRDGSIDSDEFQRLLDALTASAAPAGEGDLQPHATGGAGSSHGLSTLALSDNPAHDLKVLINNTLVDVARELGLNFQTLPGASYPAVVELQTGADLRLSPEQVSLRRQITELVAERLSTDPALPAGVRVQVENPEAGGGADRIAISTTGGEPLVFDVITGKGILKTRIAKNYLADKHGMGVAQIHGAQLSLLSGIANQLARGAEAYQRLASAR